MNYKDLFLFYEVLGDLYIQEYAILKKFLNYNLIKLSPLIGKAYLNYKKSFFYRKVVEKKEPHTHYAGLRGIPHLPILYDFYKDIHPHINGVHKKLEFISEKYPNLVNNIVL